MVPFFGLRNPVEAMTVKVMVRRITCLPISVVCLAFLSVILTLSTLLVGCGDHEKAEVTPATPSPVTVTLPEEFGPLPPLQLTLSGSTPQGWKWVDETWYGGTAGSRNNRVESVNIPGQSPGDFIVFDGKQAYLYSAETNTYHAPRTSTDFSMVRCLTWSDWKDRCASPTVTLGPVIAGRPTFHIHCEGFDLWLDRETGLVLKSVEPDMTKEVTSIEYDPVFPKGIFEFVPPPGARELK